MLQTLLKVDQSLSQRLRFDPASCRWWRPATLLAHSGDSWLWASGLALLWLMSRGRWHDLAAIFLIAIVLQALLVFPLKMLIRRQRPQGEWGSIYRTIDPHSFPSGHAARAALLVTLAFGLAPAWLAWGLAVWAPFMALSRVMTGVHYLSDLLGGVLVGIGFGLLSLWLVPLWNQWLPFLF